MIVLLALGCTPPASEVALHVPSEHLEVFRDFVEMAEHPGLSVDDGEAGPRGHHWTLIEDLDGEEVYRIEATATGLEIHGSDRLGLQYGLADALERAGFRFFHPSRTHRPIPLAVEDERGLGELVAPQMARRGLHLHTLHPIEGTYDFWEPSDEGLERAKRTVDWVVKNRGNHLQWVGLDDIVRYPGLVEDWTAHTRAIVDYAHQRGLTVGLGVQLFGSSNLQLAFDLVDGDPAEIDWTEVDRRLDLYAAVDPDLLSLSFGEFSGVEPATFVQTGTLAVQRMQERLPGVEVATTIHVGNYEDLRVEWEGEEILYYFLADAIPGTTPWVHTVMYYDLFEDAGGAYLHDEFTEHREYLLERLRAGRPVGYHPESAYWVAFDINVPTYLPLYLRTRFTDLDRIRAEGLSLQDHVTFSSGWEWGYWQTDYAILRMNHTLPERWEDVVRHAWAPWGEQGAELAEVIVALADRQHEALIVDRLAAYLAGREAIIDFGDTTLGIVSQPDRPQLAEIVAMDAAGRAEVAAKVAGLQALASDTDALLARLDGLGGTDPWFAEVRDGVQVDALRARFAHHVFAGALAVAEGGDGEAELAAATDLMRSAQRVVDRRHAALWWGGGERLVAQEDPNPTLYQFGYLAKADDLCFWERERVQLSNLVRGENASVPPCT